MFQIRPEEALVCVTMLVSSLYKSSESLVVIVGRSLTWRGGNSGTSDSSWESCWGRYFSCITGMAAKTRNEEILLVLKTILGNPNPSATDCEKCQRASVIKQAIGLSANNPAKQSLNGATQLILSRVRREMTSPVEVLVFERPSEMGRKEK